jgi:hypothetical protein
MRVFWLNGGLVFEGEDDKERGALVVVLRALGGGATPQEEPSGNLESRPKDG